MKVEKRNPALSMSSVSEDLVEDIITKKIGKLFKFLPKCKTFCAIPLKHVLSTEKRIYTYSQLLAIVSDPRAGL